MADTTDDAAAPDGAPSRVWMYWEKRKPTSIRTPYLDLCLETVEANLDGLNLEVIDERTIYDWLPDLDQATWERLPRPASRSDYGRNRLLWRYGGIYLDFDCVVIDSLRRLLEPLSDTSLAGWGDETEGLFFNNLLAARAGSPFLEQWIVAQDRLLHGSDDWPALGYAALGQHLAGDIARQVEHHSFAENQVAPIPWHQAARFRSTTESPAPLLSCQPITVMLWNRAMGERLEHVSAEQLLTGKTLLSRLLRIGSGRSTLDEELDLRTRLHVVSDVSFSGPAMRFRGWVHQTNDFWFSAEQRERKMRHANRMLREGKELDEVLSILRVRRSVWDRWQVRYGGAGGRAEDAGGTLDGLASPGSGPGDGPAS
jgi:Glycosyltransferase sugar-binding region containing DXD motif